MTPKAKYQSLSLKIPPKDPKPLYMPPISAKAPVRTLTPAAASVISNLPKGTADLALFISIKAKSDNSITINTKLIKEYQAAVRTLIAENHQDTKRSEPIGYQAVKKHIISLINSFILIKLPTPKPVYLVNPCLSHIKRPEGMTRFAYGFSQKYTELYASGALTLEACQLLADQYHKSANQLLDKVYRNPEARAKVNLSVAKSRANKKKNKLSGSDSTNGPKEA